MSEKLTRSIKIFYSYAHEDKWLRDKLDMHLSGLKHSGKITTWYDREILPGREREHEIDQHLNSADIILLLVSPYFMASKYCYSEEVKRAMERHQNGEAVVIPILLRPVHLEYAPFGALQSLPDNRKAITVWPGQNRAFFDVVTGIGNVVEQLLSQGAK